MSKKLKCKTQILKKRELAAVQQCAEYLKENCTCRGLFVTFGSRLTVLKIVAKIKAGDEHIRQYLKNYSTPRECATALNHYLRNLGKPLLSKRVQELILSENHGVCPRVVALDALSLLSEDLQGIDKDLFITIMSLMKVLSTAGSLKPTEVRVSHAPYLLIPVFFPFSPDNHEKLTKCWRNMCDILNEMVICFDFFLMGAHFKPDCSIFNGTTTQTSETATTIIGIQPDISRLVTNLCFTT